MNEADFKKLASDSIFDIADDLMKAQIILIQNQNNLIAKLIDRIDWLEHQQEK